jgi:DNA-binding CsgD family transcriptional regulator
LFEEFFRLSQDMIPAIARALGAMSELAVQDRGLQGQRESECPPAIGSHMSLPNDKLQGADSSVIKPQMNKTLHFPDPNAGKSRVEQAESRAEQAESRTEQAKTRTESAETRAEQAETRTEFAKTRTENAELRTDQAETRAEQAETALEILIQKETVTAPLKTSRATETTDLLALEGLTARQREILQLIAKGENTKHIADMLKISPKTVEYHRLKVMSVLGVHDVPGLVRFALRVGLISP